MIGETNLTLFLILMAYPSGYFYFLFLNIEVIPHGTELPFLCLCTLTEIQPGHQIHTNFTYACILKTKIRGIKEIHLRKAS